jgi:hypothetical protein
MSAVLGISIIEGEMRPVPKFVLNFSEVIFCLGSEGLALELREIGALVPARRQGRVLLFDVDHVREVWERLKAGHYDGQLKKKGVFAE